MIDWVPVAFLTFKVLIFGACMFFAIKWHYDQGNKVMDRRALVVMPLDGNPDGQVKFPHPWPPQIPPGRTAGL